MLQQKVTGEVGLALPAGAPPAAVQVMPVGAIAAMLTRIPLPECATQVFAGWSIGAGPLAHTPAVDLPHVSATACRP